MGDREKRDESRGETIENRGESRDKTDKTTTTPTSTPTTPTPTKRHDILFLFDVDGTLSESRKVAPPSILEMLKELKKRVTIAFVGGSDLSKQLEQIGPDLLEIFDYGFPENGVIFYKEGKEVSGESLVAYLGEAKYKAFINKALQVLSEAEVPFKRGLFIELRRSMVNLSPVGRSCTHEERDQFYEFDKKAKVRKEMAEKLKGLCDELGLQISIGGKISIDVFPKGWDKTFCLRHVDQKEIFFFGDMTMKDGNDYEIANHPRVKGTTVSGPEDTIKRVNEKLRGLGMGETE